MKVKASADLTFVVLVYIEKSQGEDDKIIETRTNVKGADFTDAVVADFSSEVFFGRVDAREAIFGYTEKLISRRKRHQKRHEESGKIPTAEDTGGLFSFNGSEGEMKIYFHFDRANQFQALLMI